MTARIPDVIHYNCPGEKVAKIYNYRIISLEPADLPLGAPFLHLPNHGTFDYSEKTLVDGKRLEVDELVQISRPTLVHIGVWT